MAQPCTVQFGLWSPDLDNVAVQMPIIPGPIPVPCADCLNVYYQDGAYRCVPSPQPIGPSLGSQALNAFTWYDETSGDEIVFAATANGISGLTSDEWISIPVLNALSIALSGLSLKLNVGAAILLQSNGITLSQGSVAITRSELLSASMLTGEQAGGIQTGYQSGSFGQLSPSTDVNGNLVTVLKTNSDNITLTLTIATAGLGQSYFSSINTTVATYTSASATYSSSGGVSTWVWPDNPFFNPGTSYPITIYA
jgi:hypothetical protein